MSLIRGSQLVTSVKPEGNLGTVDFDNREESQLWDAEGQIERRDINKSEKRQSILNPS